MRVYDIDFSPGGRIEIQIPKAGVTAPEILLLRHIHGEDAVKNVRPRTMDRRPHADEFERLVASYSVPERPGRVERFFGVMPGMPIKLPVALSAAELQEIEAAGGVDKMAEADEAEASKASGGATARGKLGLGGVQEGRA